MPRPGRCSDLGRMRSKRSGRAPGRPCEPFRAIQGAHATEADPNESHVSFFVGLHFFLPSRLAWRWLRPKKWKRFEPRKQACTVAAGTRVGGLGALDCSKRLAGTSWSPSRPLFAQGALIAAPPGARHVRMALLGRTAHLSRRPWCQGARGDRTTAPGR